MNLSFQPDKGEFTNLVTLENDSPQKQAIELRVIQRVMNEYGEESYETKTDDLVIFPEQVILSAGEKRKVRVQLVKKTVPDLEKAYRLICEQLPIKSKKDESQNNVKTNINILLKYVAGVYIIPKEIKKSWKLIQSEVAVNSKKVLFQIQNDGTVHLLLNRPKIKLVKAGKEYEFTEDELKGVSGENILAGSSRKFELIIPPRIQVDSNQYRLSVTFDE